MTMFDFAALALVKHQDWPSAQKDGIYRAFLEPRCRIVEGTPGTMLGDVQEAIEAYTSNRIDPFAFAGRLFAIGASYLGQRIVEDMTGFEAPFEADYDESLTSHMRSLITEGVK